MSWDKTYSHTVALGVDRLGAALVFNQPDITISSLCWIVRQVHSEDMVQRLKLYPWQLWLLRRIGNFLEHFWPGHCADARQGDLDTSARARLLLGA
jgi:hypothetical protein